MNTLLKEIETCEKNIRKNTIFFLKQERDALQQIYDLCQESTVVFMIRTQLELLLSCYFSGHPSLP